MITVWRSQDTELVIKASDGTGAMWDGISGIAAEIRRAPSHTSDLIATWTVDTSEIGVGRIRLTIPQETAALITDAEGWADVKGLRDGRPVNVCPTFRVTFADSPTAVTIP